MAGGPQVGPSRQPTGWRRWAFPLAAATLAPLALLTAAELGLRAAGVGHPTGFFVPVPGQPAEATNPHFGWRFFPPAIARSPVIDRLQRPKPAAVFRIFVLGGSAAMGTPEPAFGFGRLLEVLLEERYPGTDFEVVNAAMAAINSHVALEIVRDAVRRQPDMFLVYLGNNEVVGPYGPGTVFAPAGAGLRTIRLGLRLRELRTGQWIAGGLSALRPARPAPVRWRGMEMFRERWVAADDPRLERTYRQFADNLMEIARLAARAEAPLLLSTVAVDLRDSPPFASLHRPGLSEVELARWQEAVDRASRRAVAGQLEAALADLRLALEIDDRHAELQFRVGRLALLSGDGEAARRHLSRARDLDALRFRAGTRINETIREVAARAPGVRLVDAERRLAAAPESASGMPGRELFWEHVHLRFAGNYRLAEAFLEALQPLLPAAIRARAAAPPPASPERVAELLGLTSRDEWRMAESIHQMTRRPPFTGQLGHESRQLASKRSLQRLRSRAAASRGATVATYRRALERRPDDIQLRRLLASALDDHGATAAAAEAWQELIRRLPEVPGWHARLGFALAAEGRHEEALVELRRALELAPESPGPRVDLATLLAQRDDLQAAERLYREALAIDAASEAARGNLADLLDRQGLPDQAEQQLRELIELDPSSSTAHRRLGELLDRHGDHEPAIAAYRRALELDPELAPVHNNLGYLLAESGRFDEAAAEYLRAIDDDPAYELAYFNLGDLLLGLGRAAEAAEAYRAGLAVEPGNRQARANLARAEALAGS